MAGVGARNERNPGTWLERFTWIGILLVDRTGASFAGSVQPRPHTICLFATCESSPLVTHPMPVR